MKQSFLFLGCRFFFVCLIWLTATPLLATQEDVSKNAWKAFYKKRDQLVNADYFEYGPSEEQHSLKEKIEHFTSLLRWRGNEKHTDINVILRKYLCKPLIELLSGRIQGHPLSAAIPESGEEWRALCFTVLAAAFEMGKVGSVWGWQVDDLLPLGPGRNSEEIQNNWLRIFYLHGAGVEGQELIKEIGNVTQEKNAQEWLKDPKWNAFLDNISAAGYVNQLSIYPGKRLSPNHLATQKKQVPTVLFLNKESRPTKGFSLKTPVKKNIPTIKLGGHEFYKFQTPGGGLCGYFALGEKPDSFEVNDLPDAEKIVNFLKNRKRTCSIFTEPPQGQSSTDSSSKKNHEIVVKFDFGLVYYPGKNIYMHLKDEHFSYLVPTDLDPADTEIGKGRLLEKLAEDIDVAQRLTKKNNEGKDYIQDRLYALYNNYFEDVKKLENQKNK